MQRGEGGFVFSSGISTWDNLSTLHPPTIPRNPHLPKKEQRLHMAVHLDYKQRVLEQKYIQAKCPVRLRKMSCSRVDMVAKPKRGLNDTTREYKISCCECCWMISTVAAIIKSFGQHLT